MSIRVVVYTNPFTNDTEERDYPYGDSYREIAKTFSYSPVTDGLFVFNGESRICDYHDVPEDGSVIVIRAMPRGGGPRDERRQRKAANWSIVGGAGLFLLGTAINIASMGTLGWGLKVTGIGMIATGIGLHGALNRKVGIHDQDIPERLPSIRGARNSARNNATVPVLIGTHYIAPDYITKPHTAIIGRFRKIGDVSLVGTPAKQYLTQSFHIGYGDCTVTDLRIGETDFGSYEQAEYELCAPGVKGELVKHVAAEEYINATIEYGAEPVIRATADDTDGISVDIAFPNGLAVFDGEGKRLPRQVRVLASYRAIGGSWTVFWDQTFQSRVIQTLRFGQTIRVSTGKYEVKVEKMTANIEGNAVDSMQWSVLRSFRDSYPYSDDVIDSTTRLNIRVVATDQLHSMIDTFNCVASVKMPVYSGSGTGSAQWGNYQVTSNPASALLWVMKSGVAERPIPDSRIHWGSLEHFYNVCASKGYTCDGILDAEMPRIDMMLAICETARATVIDTGTKFEVIVDEEKTPVGHITPKNSSDFSVTQSFVKLTNKAEVRYIDAASGYHEVIRTIPYGSQPIEPKSEKIDTWGITNRDNLWKWTVFRIAETHLRRRVYSVTMDYESMFFRRGDWTYLTNDLALAGIATARITGITASAGQVNAITLDEYIAVEASKNYGMRIRNSPTGSVWTEAIVNTDTTTDTFNISPSISEASLALGDLVQFGIKNQETRLAMIVEIQKGTDLTANITAIDAAPSLFTVESGAVPVYDPEVTLPHDPVLFMLSAPMMVLIADHTATIPQSDGSWINQIIVSVHPRSSDTELVSVIEVQYRIYGDDSSFSSITTSVSSNVVHISPVDDGFIYEVRARVGNAIGQFSAWTTDTVTVQGKALPPLAVSSISSVTNLDGTVSITWGRASAKDVSYYIVKLGPVWEEAITIFQGDATSYVYKHTPYDYTTNTVQVKAVDTSGNMSETAVTDTYKFDITGTVAPVTVETSGTMAALKWNVPITGNLGIKHYEIRRELISDVSPPTTNPPNAFTSSQWGVTDTQSGNEVQVSVTALPSSDEPITSLQYRINGGAATLLSEAASEPSAFTSGQWGVTDAQTSGDITLSITSLPASDEPITSVQYRLNGGSAISL